MAVSAPQPPPDYEDPALARLLPYVPRVVTRHFGRPDTRVAEVDATSVFVDVSGFTALSERLARKGREGAEHLTEAIGSSFQELLATAYRNGGSLLKFGGDALLLLFEDEGHVERAARAALGMQDRLACVGRIDAGGARVVLRMSAGVHTGPFHLFCCGASHRELVVAGPAASATVRMEELAAAGQVVVSPATAARLPARCLGHAVGEGRLLRRAPDGEDRAPVEPELQPTREIVRAALSREVLARVEGGEQQPEHRVVSVAFVHASGLDDVLRADGPRTAAAALEEVLACAQQAADDHEVCSLATDVTPGGVKLILTAGAPRSAEDDEERLLLALRRVVEADLALSVRAGAHRGPVFAGDIGPPYRKTYTVMGDAVNLAARLMARAEPGELIASPAVLDRSQTRFAAWELEPFHVKGKAEPVTAWSVGPALGRRITARSADGPLLGRDAELQALESVLRGAREGRGRLVEISGEAGIGKSRLAEEVCRRAAGFRVVHATCEPYTASTPYALWRQVLRGLLRETPHESDAEVAEDLAAVVRERAPELEPWLPLLLVAFAVDAPATPEVEDLAPEFRRAKLEEVVAALLRVLVRTPTLIEVEDVHHMDAASAELLAALGPQFADTHGIALLTRRDAACGFIATDGPALLRLAPAPLDAAQALALAEQLTEDHPLPPHLVAMAADRSGGNPQLLRDLLSEAAAGGGLPESIEAAATARIDRLGPADRALLRRASVLGVTFDRSALDVVLDPGAPAVDAGTWRRLAPFLEVGGDRIRFRRPVVREAAYRGLPFGLRRRLHGAAAEHLERAAGDEAAGVLSLHFLLAGRHTEAWRYARRAGDLARDRFATADAAYLYRRALEAARSCRPPREDVADVWCALGDAHQRTGEPASAARAFTAARRLTEDPVRRARIMHRHAMLLLDAGGTTAAVRWASRGLRVLADVDGTAAAAQRAQLTAALAGIRQRQGRTGEAVVLCRRAIADAEAAGERAALARALYVLDWALVESGRHRTDDGSARALALLRAEGDLHGESTVLNNMGNFAFREGRWTEAIDLWEASATAALRAGDVVSAAYGDVNVGELTSDAGRFTEAERRLRAALRVFRGTDNLWAAAYAEALTGRLEVRTGRVRSGTERLQHAAQAFAALAAHQDRAWTAALAAEAQLAAGEAESAASTATDLLRDHGCGARLVPLLERVRALALAALGDVDAARRALEHGLGAAREQDDAYEVALCLDAAARLDPTPDPEAVSERDAIVRRLGIVRLPALEPTAVAPTAA